MDSAILESMLHVTDKENCVSNEIVESHGRKVWSLFEKLVGGSNFLEGMAWVGDSNGHSKARNVDNPLS